MTPGTIRKSASTAVGFLFALLLSLGPPPAHAIHAPRATTPSPNRSAEARPLRLEDLGNGRVRSSGPVQTLSNRKLGREELAGASLRYLTDADLRGPVPLELDYVAEIPLRTGQGDLVHVQFIQKSDGFTLWGGRAHVTVRRDNTGSTVLSAVSNLYEKVDLPPRAPQTDNVLKARAARVLGLPPDRTSSLPEIRRFIARVEDKLRRLRELGSEEETLHALVDEDTADSSAAWVFDPRLYIESQAAGAEPDTDPSYIFGDVHGNGYLFDPVSSSDFDRLALKHLEVEATTPTGTFTTLTRLFGLFRFKDIQEPASVAATLLGSWVQVNNSAGPILSLNAIATPGVPLRLLFNESGSSDEDTAQVDAYFHVDFIHDWIQSRFPTPLPGLDTPIETWVNGAESCNASYFRSTLWFLQAGPWPPEFGVPDRWCLNSAYDTVIYHEYGHFVDDMAGGPTDYGLGEGWGDLIGALATSQPLLGENFFGPGTTFRTADNTYSYPWDDLDEIHNLGQAWSGFGWDLRENLILTYGESEGITLAEELLVPRLLSNPMDIPAAVFDVLLADDDNGDLTDLTPNFADIDSAARRHNLSPHFNTAVALETAPTGANFIASEQPSVTIEGLADTSAVGLPFQDYQLLYGLGLAPPTYTPIGPPVTTPVAQVSPLGEWEIGDLSTGTYLIRVQVTAAGGLQFQDLGLVGIESRRFAEISRTHQPRPSLGYAGDGYRLVWVSPTRTGDALFTCLYNPQASSCEDERRLPAGREWVPKAEPALSGSYVVWTEGTDVHLFDLVTALDYPIASDPTRTQFQPAISGDVIAWSEYPQTGGPFSVAACTFDPLTGTCPKRTLASAPQEDALPPTPQVSGNLVVWSDIRTGDHNVYLYDLATQVEHQLTNDAFGQIAPSVWGDLVVWQNYRSETDTDIYGCRFDPVSGQCPNRAIVAQPSFQFWPRLQSRVLTWLDARNATQWGGIARSNWDVYSCRPAPDAGACPERQVTANLGPVALPQNTGSLVLWYDEREGGPFTYLAEVP